MERLERLRALAYEAPTEERWAELGALLDGLEGDALEVGVDYVAQALGSWPLLVRAIPESWWRRLVRGEAAPMARLGGLRRIWSAEAERGGDFGLWTACLHAAVSADLRHAALCDAAEWHHNGGDCFEVALEGGQERLRWSGLDDHGEVHDLAYSLDGRWLAAVFAHEMVSLELRLWRRGEANEAPWVRMELSGFGDEANGVEVECGRLAISPGGRWLACASMGTGQVFVLDLGAEEIAASLKTLEVPRPCALAFAQDERLLVGTMDGALWSLDPADGEVVGVHKFGVSCPLDAVAVQGQEVLVIARGARAIFKVVEENVVELEVVAIRDGVLVESFRVSGEAVVPLPLPLVGLPGGGFRAVTLDGPEVRVWDLPGGAVRSLPGWSQWDAVGLSADGRAVVFGDAAEVWLWLL